MINFKEEQERSSHLYNKYQKGANVLLKRSIAAIDTMANRFNMHVKVDLKSHRLHDEFFIRTHMNFYFDHGKHYEDTPVYDFFRRFHISEMDHDHFILTCSADDIVLIEEINTMDDKEFEVWKRFN